MALARPIVAAAPSVLLFEKFGSADLLGAEASSQTKEAARWLTA